MASVAFALPGVGLAQEDPEEPPPEAAAPESEEASNITAYPPSFFAEFRPNTAMDMINRLPGFSFDGGSGARGFAGTAGNVLIDGERPPSRGDSLSSVLSRIPASAVARIDVVRGGAGGIDMEGRSVVANVIRKPDAGLTGALSGAVNWHLNGEFSPNGQVQAQRQWNGRLLEGSFSMGRNNNANKGMRFRLDPNGVPIEFLHGLSTFHGWNTGLTGAFETPLAGGKLRINGQANHQDNNSADNAFYLIRELQDGPGGQDISINENQRTSGEAGLRYSRLFGGVEVETVLFQSMVQSESESDSVGIAFSNGNISESRSGETISSVNLRLPQLGNWSLETGGEVAFNFTESSSQRTLNGAPFGLAGDTSRVEELRSEVFGVGTWSPSQKLSVESAVRYEQSTISATSNAGASEKTLRFVKPRLNVSWTPWSGHQFNLRVERVVEQLSFGAFASSVNFNNNLANAILGIGNLELEPERAWVGSLRYERRFGGQGSIVAELVHRQIEAVLGRVVVPAPTATDPARTAEITRNVGEATRTQLNVSANIPLDRYGVPGGILEFGVNLRESETLDPVTLIARELSNDTPYSWNISFSQNIERWNLRYAVFLEDDDESFSFAPRSVSGNDGEYFLGANFSWKPRPDLTIGGGLNNIAGNTGYNTTLFFTAPRDIGVPLYFERRFGSGIPTAFVTVRKNF